MLILLEYLNRGLTNLSNTLKLTLLVRSIICGDVALYARKDLRAQRADIAVSGNLEVVWVKLNLNACLIAFLIFSMPSYILALR